MEQCTHEQHNTRIINTDEDLKKLQEALDDYLDEVKYLRKKLDK